MLIDVEGNLLESECDGIIHQVNCLGKMGSGIARQIREKWPGVYWDYKKAYQKGQLKLGNVIISEYGPIVYNMCSQFDYCMVRGCRKVHTDYHALTTALRIILKHAKEIELKRVGVPFGIGCGLGGGNWETVKAILEDISNDEGVDIYIYKLSEDN